MGAVGGGGGGPGRNESPEEPVPVKVAVVAKRGTKGAAQGALASVLTGNAEATAGAAPTVGTAPVGTVT